MGYASRDKRPLRDIAVVDEVTIQQIAALVPASGITIEDVLSDTHIADAVAKKHSTGSDNQDLSSFITGSDPRLTDARAPTYHTHESSGGLTQSQILTRQL